MIRPTLVLLVLATALAVLVLPSAPALAQEKQPNNPAAKPLNRDISRHKQFLQIAKKGNVDVLFLGDSITQGWEGNGKEAWKKNFEPLKAANFGIGGDQTGHVLWRLTQGKELEGIKPKVAVIMIGTNNMAAHKAQDIAGGIEAIVHELHERRPDCKILLLGIFPRSPKPTDPVRAKIKEANSRIAKLDDGKAIYYKDIGEKFLQPDGTLSKEIMYDFLHLTAKGYTIWAEAIKPDVEKLLQ
jgi:lysophospholipase L1-like esterase